MATKAIYDIISEKFPGVELESPVQGWVYLEEYEKGIEAHQDIIPLHTTAHDDRWLGVCYFQLFDDFKALELFFRAVARGSEGARINLAHAFIFTDRTDQVIPELNKIDLERLSAYDLVLFYRVKSFYAEGNGDLRQAANNAETAWRFVQAIPELPILAPQILNQLGVLYGRLGKANQALWFFEQSLHLLPEGMERTKAILVKAQLLNTLGHYEKAIQELQSLTLDKLPQALNAFRLIVLGDASWGKKDTPAAEQYYEKAIIEALESSTFYEEFLSRLSLASIYGSQGLSATAGEHLARAKVLVSDKADELLHLFRDTLVSFWTEELSVTEVQNILGGLVNEFDKTGLLQEQGWVKLHIAEMYRQLGNETDMLRELDTLQSLATTLQNSNFLAREWTLVPELYKLAFKTHPKIAGRPPNILEIYTMGEEKLALNGKVINIRMKKGVEIIAYFLEHGKVSLKKMLLDIFPDDDPKKARNYFHQVKHELHERLPGLRLEYLSDERLYALATEFDILWDVAELRAGRKMGALGVFLPGSGSEWAEVLEHQLSPLKETGEVFPAETRVA